MYLWCHVFVCVWAHTLVTAVWHNHIFQRLGVILFLSSLHIPVCFKHFHRVRALWRGRKIKSVCSLSVSPVIRNSTGNFDIQLSRALKKHLSVRGEILATRGVQRKMSHYSCLRDLVSPDLFAFSAAWKKGEAAAEVFSLKPKTQEPKTPNRSSCLLHNAASMEKKPFCLCRQAQFTHQWMSEEGLGLICLAGIPQEL